MIRLCTKDIANKIWGYWIAYFNNENIGNLNVFPQKIAANFFHNVILDARKNEGRYSYFSK